MASAPGRGAAGRVYHAPLCMLPAYRRGPPTARLPALSAARRWEVCCPRWPSVGYPREAGPRHSQKRELSGCAGAGLAPRPAPACHSRACDCSFSRTVVQWLRTGWLKTAGICSRTVVGAGGPKSRCRWGWFLKERPARTAVLVPQALLALWTHHRGLCRLLPMAFPLCPSSPSYN